MHPTYLSSRCLPIVTRPRLPRLIRGEALTLGELGLRHHEHTRPGADFDEPTEARDDPRCADDALGMRWLDDAQPAVGLTSAQQRSPGTPLPPIPARARVYAPDQR